MEAYLDIKTLSIVTTLLSLCYFFGLLLLQRIQEPILGLNLVASALLILGWGFLLLGVTPVSESPLSDMLAFSLIGVAYALLVHGLCRFRQAPFNYFKLVYPLLPIMILSVAYFSYISPSDSVRLNILNSYTVLCIGLCAFANALGRAEDLKAARLVLTAGLVLEGCFTLFEVFWTAISSAKAFQASVEVVQQVTLISLILMIIFLGFSITWMITGRLVATMYDSAIRDGLTGLYNRRALEELAPKEVARSRRHSDPLSIVLIDIDCFKKINDTYSHQVGDSVLRKTAKLIIDATRKEDVSFRYGGEEFLAILPATSLNHAAIVASKLRKRIEQANLLPSNVDRCTSSFGVAEFHSHDSWEKLVERADKALYMAKHNGRNTVFLADKEHSYRFKDTPTIPNSPERRTLRVKRKVT